MSRLWLAGTSALALVTVCGAFAHAEDVTAKKIFIKDNADPTKKQAKVLSKDVGVQYTEAVSPDVTGASLHLYSGTDDMCVLLYPGTDWQNTGTVWKYKNLSTKNIARIGDGKLLVKIKTEPGLGFTLNEGMQTTVNAQVQFGTGGTRYCMKCPGNTKDDTSKFLGKDCAMAACDAEAPGCSPATTSTSTSTSTSSSTSTSCPPGPPPHTVLKGSLTATVGRFNYNATLGLPGANAACNTNFAGTHACSYTELQAAKTACDLPGLQDTASMTVTSFWAIASDAATMPNLQQCLDDAVGGSNKNWEYGTAHTASRGQKVALDSPSGNLGPLQSGLQCNFSGSSWVGCCQ